MLGFLIKKSFFDAWDNLLTFILLNLGYILCLAVLILLPAAAGDSSFITTILLAVPGFLLIQVYTGAASYLMFELAESRSINFKMIKDGLKRTWKPAILFSFLNTLILVTLLFAWNFYLTRQGFVFMLAAGVIFWITLIWLLSLQHFFPVIIRLDESFLSGLKKSLLVSLDNPLFSMLELLLSILLFAISIITLLFLPGITGILILHQNALKLRLCKYDWLEENPESKKIPWDILLKEDRDKLGHRSLKGMIFPWKD